MLSFLLGFYISLACVVISGGMFWLSYASGVAFWLIFAFIGERLHG